MKNIYLCLLLIGGSIAPLMAQKDCLTVDNLKKMDASWEKGQLEGDREALDALLAKDFMWVHNHANTIDDKEAVLNRADRVKTGKKEAARSRNSEEVKVVISGTTAIVSGFTIVDRGPKPTRYHFMRTYVEQEGKCKLLSNHTMAIPENEE